MKEYRIAKGWAIFIYLTAPLLIALFCWLLAMPFISESVNNAKLFWFLAPVSIAMIALIIVGLLDAIKGKFVIDNDQIFAVHPFSNRRLKFDEIKGYTVNDKYIVVEPNIDGIKRIKISKYFGKRDEIIEWLSSRYPDLDLLKGEEEHQEILNNEAFGWTAKQREDKLNKARRAANLLNWAGGLAAIWTIFWPKPYEYAIILSIALPIISIAVFRRFRGLIRIDNKKGSAYPSISLAILVLGMALGLRAVLDFHIFDYSKVWIPSIFITIIFIALLLISNKEFKSGTQKNYAGIIALSFFIFGYAYGSVITINCLYDKTNPEIFSAKIISKRISTGKSTTYYFELTSWGQQKKKGEVSVSKALYNRLTTNEEVNIYFKKGLFKIPWFIVTAQNN